MTQKVPKTLRAIESKSHHGQVNMLKFESIAAQSLLKVTEIIAKDIRVARAYDVAISVEVYILEVHDCAR